MSQPSHTNWQEARESTIARTIRFPVDVVPQWENTAATPPFTTSSTGICLASLQTKIAMEHGPFEATPPIKATSHQSIVDTWLTVRRHFVLTGNWVLSQKWSTLGMPRALSSFLEFSRVVNIRPTWYHMQHMTYIYNIYIYKIHCFFKYFISQSRGFVIHQLSAPAIAKAHGVRWVHRSPEAWRWVPSDLSQSNGSVLICDKWTWTSMTRPPHRCRISDWSNCTKTGTYATVIVQIEPVYLDVQEPRKYVHTWNVLHFLFNISHNAVSNIHPAFQVNLSEMLVLCCPTVT